LGIELIL